MKHIAVVGSGIAGLGAALALSQRHRVTLLEAASKPGGHVNTVELNTPDGPVAIDTGFIVYNEPNYPNLTRLFKHLGVRTHATEMSFSVSLDAGAFEYAGSNLATLFCQPRNLLSPRFLRMLLDINRFNTRAKLLITSAETPGTYKSLAEFLQAENLGDDFKHRYLLPMAAAIWSCPTEQMGEFPVVSMARFFHNHGLLNLRNRPQWRVVSGGSEVYVSALLEQFGGTLQLGTEVVKVRRSNKGVDVTDRQGHCQNFDHVVFATHADTSVRLLEDSSALERRLLSVFKYQSNTALLHTDPALMPRRTRAWSAWNYLGSEADEDSSAVSVTYWMNCLQSLLAPQNYFVTLNPTHTPREETVLKRISYEHPVFDADALHAQSQLDKIQYSNKVSFCGAYCGYGFHEDGLRSGLKVAAQLGANPSWATASAG